MSRRVLWSPSSRDDLVRIGRAIAIDNPAAARAVTNRLRAAGDALAEMATGRPGRVAATYEKVLPRLPYILAYELVADDEGETVAILRVIHGRRDWTDEHWPD